jgi:hypothetical protein
MDENLSNLYKELEEKAKLSRESTDKCNASYDDITEDEASIRVLQSTFDKEVEVLVLNHNKILSAMRVAHSEMCEADRALNMKAIELGRKKREVQHKINIILEKRRAQANLVGSSINE